MESRNISWTSPDVRHEMPVYAELELVDVLCVLKFAPQWLVGVDLDMNWTDLSRVNWLTSMRGRIGFLPALLHRRCSMERNRQFPSKPGNPESVEIRVGRRRWRGMGAVGQ
jgi:hypothetical protein